MLPLALLLAGLYAPDARAAGHVTAVYTCTSATFTFSDFPNANGNTVTEILTVDGKRIREVSFSFNGPSGSNTISFTHLSPGHHSMDGHAKWKTNGIKGGKDIKAKHGLTCPADPGFAIEKLQKLEPGAYTKTTLFGHLGETVDYEIVVTNTGGVSLTFSNFEDPHCDAGTLKGGPGEAALEPGKTTTYFCDHVVTAADIAVGSYTNTATVTGTPPEGFDRVPNNFAGGTPITHTSNTVVIELPNPENNAEFSCKAVTFTFTDFPNLPNNTVTEIITVDGSHVFEGTFVFNGPSGSNTVVLNLPPGHHSIDAHAKWDTNGYKGGKDIKGKGGLNCPEPESGFSIEKRQEIAGSGGGFTTSPLTGKVGQTVDYEIIVKNTGTVPLTFSGFSDAKCDEGTIGGGPGASPVAPGASTTYTCDDVLTEVGSYTNSASDTATPPEGDGEPFSHSSNSVVTEVPPEPGFSIEKQQEIAGSGGGFTKSKLAGKDGQTVDYEIIVKNTGNVPLTFSGFNDEFCGAVTGGPGASPVEPGASTTYLCSEELQGFAGLHGNSASVNGTPPLGDGSEIAHESNTVLVEVPAEPGFTIEKLQEISGSGKGFTTSELIGEPGQTVDYEIVVRNTGSVSETFSEFTDEKCDAGTITGGPGPNPLSPGESTTYLCHHLLTTADELAGVYSNSASDTATPSEGSPFSETSNTVEVEVKKKI